MIRRGGVEKNIQRERLSRKEEERQVLSSEIERKMS